MRMSKIGSPPLATDLCDDCKKLVGAGRRAIPHANLVEPSHGIRSLAHRWIHQVRVRSTAVALICLFTMGAAGCIEGDDTPPRPILDGGGSEGAVDFGSMQVGATVERYAFLTNGKIFPDRVAPLEVALVEVEGFDLAIAEDGCSGSVLEQASSCSIRLVWAPSSEYRLDGRLRVVSNAPDSPSTIAVVGTATNSP
jgi:hypothetical protein